MLHLLPYAAQNDKVWYDNLHPAAKVDGDFVNDELCLNQQFKLSQLSNLPLIPH
jgi:hypothetical protein